MLASVATFGVEGVDGHEVAVEVDVRPGLPVFTIVGLPDAAVREARERVRAALLNSGLEFPLQRITANLAPADLPKAGPSFDLALAVGVLAAGGQVPSEGLGAYAVCGELSLSGELRPVRGAIAVAVGARAAGYEQLIVPVENAPEAALVKGVAVLPVPTLRRLVDLLSGRWAPDAPTPARSRRSTSESTDSRLDLADVRGQEDARRALEIAAAGGHNLLMIGPPGAGKTMLARRLPGVLPPPSFDEALEITRVHSVAGASAGGLVSERPFRSPHHTISPPGLVGGGSVPRPGEISLAHRGVLFLDELAEFSRRTLEALRQPLEDRRVEITRGQRTIVFPAAAMLVGACNPCPCGRARHDCICNELDLARYARRLSLPLLDRIDIVCQLEAARAGELMSERPPAGGGSGAVRERVLAAREYQRRRLDDAGVLANGELDARLTRRFVPLDRRAASRLLDGHRAGLLSARGHDRVLRLARTIADLDGNARVAPDHVDEAMGYRLAVPGRLAA